MKRRWGDGEGKGERRGGGERGGQEPEREWRSEEVRGLGYGTTQRKKTEEKEK